MIKSIPSSKPAHLTSGQFLTNSSKRSKLEVDQQAVESAPNFPDPHAVPDEELQRATRQHYGYG